MALLEVGGVGSLLEVLRKGIAEASVSTRENCATTLYLLSFGSLRFNALERDDGTTEVLEDVAETGSELVREQSWNILEGLRPREEVDWDAVMRGGVGHVGYRAGRAI
ncbi:U-box domain-containing protein 38-like [Dorcoceras hygrometricum]|uniref:U-box domain-containing protein 38-like n=1 Tax=Dorcoceras hygrometricum TaxID=472368 RepID=A0A2Z7BJI5_9LAMI|nr:U-box domain-containing protein 38-like [Dorcoceras hygrometricum]